MKKIAIGLTALALLGACSERDMCLSRANGDLRTLTKLTEVTRNNVERGYAIGRRERVVERNRTCDVTQPDGSVLRQICPKRDNVTDYFPVAINLNEERAKLASLEERLIQERQRVANARAQCLAMYPS